jgi:hypothetical protein
MDSTRIVPPPEAVTTWSAIVAEWGLTPGDLWWFPLTPTTRTGIVALDADAFHAALGAPWLRTLLAGRAVERVLYFREFTMLPTLEQPVADATFRYDRAEGYWCDTRVDRCDWLVYASHENSITLGGPWLIHALQRAWPAWNLHLWGQWPDSYRPAAT